ncbi:MAG: ribosome-associated translation inhibitor RaiA [Bacillales bacterium]|jgi:putative sigma-54 modulation protein|nr:ribosome-associated translation inhibitor RaiA [Bacillales bacterium]
MTFQITGKNLEIPEETKQRLTRKISDLEKILVNKNDLSECKVTVSSSGHLKKLELSINSKFGLIRAEAKEKDLITAVDAVVKKVYSQFSRVKTRIIDKKREKLGSEIRWESVQIVEKEKVEVVRTKNVKLEPLTLEDAIQRLELSDHDFYLFYDIEHSVVSVVYKRKEEGYGVIVAEK